MERKRNLIKLLGILSVLIILIAVIAGTVSADEDNPGPDHTPFFEGDTFETAPEVTAKCLTCHPTAAQDVMGTTHWTWDYTTEDGELYGKDNVVNNYCVAVDSNWPRCTSCHIGYGYANDSFDFSVEKNVDCLACHADRTIYSKYPLKAGHPVYEGEELDWPKGSGKMVPPVDLVAAASSVGAPTRANCGSCHFNGGGAPGVKHGDLDPSMVNPNYSLDVHMSPEGGDFTCQTCHTGGHDIQGSHYEYDLEGETGLMTCESCHNEAPHAEEAVNQHTEFVACQTCHIPTFAREFPTKTYWSWESAGDKEKGAVKEEINGVTVDVYNFKKGDFVWEYNVTPEYMWFDGKMDWATVGEVMDASDVIGLAVPTADMSSEGAKIFPFKSMAGRQAFDAGTNQMVVPFLFPSGENKADAYWKSWDWNLAATRGMEAAGLEFSGDLAWVDTMMYWPQTHQVAPAENALGCDSCHSEQGVLDFQALGFDAEKVAMLSAGIPSMEEVAAEEPVVEEEAEDVAVVEEPAVEEPVEEVAAVEEPADEPAVEEEPAGMSPIIWVAIIALVVLVAVAFTFSKRNQA